MFLGGVGSACCRKGTVGQALGNLLSSRPSSVGPFPHGLAHLGYRSLAAFSPWCSWNSTCSLTCMSHSPPCGQRPCLDGELGVASGRGKRASGAGPSLSCLASRRNHQDEACKIQHKALSQSLNPKLPTEGSWKHRLPTLHQSGVLRKHAQLRASEQVASTRRKSEMASDLEPAGC